MQIQLHEFLWVDFREHPVQQPDGGDTDIYKIYSTALEEEVFRQDEYSQLLIKKIINLELFQIWKFIEYQLQFVHLKHIWLHSFDLLVSANMKQLIRLGCHDKVDYVDAIFKKSKLFYKLTFVKSIKPEDLPDKFKLENIKAQVDQLEKVKDKTDFLWRILTDFQQSEYAEMIGLPNIEKQINLEIKYQKRINKQKKKSSSTTPDNQIKRVVWYGQLNQLVDIYYRCRRTVSDKGKKLLNLTNEEIVNIIINQYTDENGETYSPSTIRTILRPGRVGKRPKGDKRIDLKIDSQQSK